SVRPLPTPQQKLSPTAERRPLLGSFLLDRISPAVGAIDALLPRIFFLITRRCPVLNVLARTSPVLVSALLIRNGTCCICMRRGLWSKTPSCRLTVFSLKRGESNAVLPLMLSP